MRFVFIFSKIALLSALFFATAALADPVCKKMNLTEFMKMQTEWQGRTLLASASWCSSCKDNLQDAAKHKDRYIILVAMDEPAAVEKVLQKFRIESPCIAGEELARSLGIDKLPWERVL